MRPHKILFFIVLLSAASLAAHAQTTIYVDDDTCPLVGSGTQGDPFCAIQDGYDAAANGDEVRVLQGTYSECVFAFDFVSQKGVQIVADAFDVGDPSTAALTVIDATGLPDAQCRFAPIPPDTVGAPAAVLNLGGVGSALVGFTITGGTLGGGVLATGSVTITSNVVDGNSSPEGGGMLLYPSPCAYGDVQMLVNDNTITNNTAFADNVFFSGQGGGIFVNALAADDILDGCAVDGDIDLRVEDNTLTNNTADGSGGGIAGFTQTNVQALSAQVVITGNTIDNNTSTGNTISPDPQQPAPGGLGGGIYFSTYGYGTETVDISNNIVRGNNSNLDFGGGISAAVLTFNQADHVMTVDFNTVTGNAAGTAGGGIDLFMQLIDLPSPQTARLLATNNTVSGNTTSLDWGAGVLATIESTRSSTVNQEARVADNRILSNTSGLFAGGLAVDMFVDSDPFNQAGAILPSDGSIDIEGNQITGNIAQTGTNQGTGGGIFVFAAANGDANATVDMTLNTVASNTVDDAGGVGGVEIEVLTTIDTGGNEGFTDVRLDSSIVYDNAGVGVGGPDPGQGPGTANSATEVTYSNVFGNPGGGIATWIQQPGSNNQAEDPLLDALTFLPAQCSPTLDAGDPVLDFSAEPAPNGGRINMGHTGGKSTATASLADVNGDGAVDGIDVLRLSVSFNAAAGVPRYDAATDFDTSGLVDGTDLAFISGDFGEICP